MSFDIPENIKLAYEFTTFDLCSVTEVVWEGEAASSDNVDKNISTSDAGNRYLSKEQNE